MAVPSHPWKRALGSGIIHWDSPMIQGSGQGSASPRSLSGVERFSEVPLSPSGLPGSALLPLFPPSPCSLSRSSPGESLIPSAGAAAAGCVGWC